MDDVCLADQLCEAVPRHSLAVFRPLRSVDFGCLLRFGMRGTNRSPLGMA